MNLWWLYRIYFESGVVLGQPNYTEKDYNIAVSVIAVSALVIFVVFIIWVRIWWGFCYDRCTGKTDRGWCDCRDD